MHKPRQCWCKDWIRRVNWIKTQALAYLAVLAALQRESGIPFHVEQAKKAGASREEVISAILIGLPAAGHVVTQVLPTAIETYDAE